MNSTTTDSQSPHRKILLLHGDKQTGQLLLGRISSLKRKLRKPRSNNSNAAENNNGIPNSFSSEDCRIEIVAPDGPFIWKLDPSIHRHESNDGGGGENDLMRTWWYRDGDNHHGVEDSLNMLHSLWLSDAGFEGILGFSRGARLAHYISCLHKATNGAFFPNLKYVISVSGYGGYALPSEELLNVSICKHLNLNKEDIENHIPLDIKSMHIMGKSDNLVPIEMSRALLPSYIDPVVYEHEGGHHVPMRAADVRELLKFIDSSSCSSSSNYDDNITNESEVSASQSLNNMIPDEEHAQLQIDECESLSLIFPEEFQLLSTTENGDQCIIPGETKYHHPITYSIQLKPPIEQLEEEDAIDLWPKKTIALKVQYTVDYPDSLPTFSLLHEMNLLEFKISQNNSCLRVVEEAAKVEEGMPCVMSCVYAAREFFESGGLMSSITVAMEINDNCRNAKNHIQDDEIVEMNQNVEVNGLLKPSTAERIDQCIAEGLEISYNIGGYKAISNNNHHTISDLQSIIKKDSMNGKGGSWKYTIGLVGKPSAGKSTFFNAATAFARQRGGDTSVEDGVAIGGATMAPHPFTTIDPNIGFCLVPAPCDSCPEDDNVDDTKSTFASTHGRDSHGRRLIPVMLKDVAGLVPGAYQGRGRGNKFLDDLLDADVLIHVLDASGSADTEGNQVVVEGDNVDNKGSNPLDDIAWVHKELIQWIVTNLRTRWTTIARKGRQKLVSMFSGYKQSEAFVWDVLISVEKYLLIHEGRDRALDNLHNWDEGDLYRLVTAFLGVRFPTALALNKSDIVTSKENCRAIAEALPLHGAHVGVPMSAHQEMQFVRQHIYSGTTECIKKEENNFINSPPVKVLTCLQAAMKLREPVLVFPVYDMETFQPLPGMFNFATRDSSLPSIGMISCLNCSGGKAPSMWDEGNKIYYPNPNGKECGMVLRDCLVMKPNSTVEDVFESLKRLGALSGEFVRAEGMGNIGEKPKLVKKDDYIRKNNRILKIMTTKRREWQKATNH